jgi:hypothetical protein
MQARAAQENHQDRQPDARRENSPRSSKLDDRYGKIGIPAVAAAHCCKGEQRKAHRPRHRPQDSD